MGIITSQYSGCTTLKLLATALQSQKIHHCNLPYIIQMSNESSNTVDAFDQSTTAELLSKKNATSEELWVSSSFPQ